MIASRFVDLKSECPENDEPMNLGTHTIFRQTHICGKMWRQRILITWRNRCCVCCVRWERFPLAPKWILPSCLARTWSPGTVVKPWMSLESNWIPRGQVIKVDDQKGKLWSATGRLNVNGISRVKVFWTSKHIIKHHKISKNIREHQKTSKTSITHQKTSYIIIFHSPRPQHPSIY